MSDKTSIEWTDATWNPVRGCSRVSPGCEHCYAERVAARFSGPGQPYEGLATMHKHRIGPLSEPRWTGNVRLVPEHLADPLRWKRPRRIFVNSMSDLFHERLTNEEIAAVFGVMAAAPRHTFQVLTKRPERMRDWFSGSPRAWDWVLEHPVLCGDWSHMKQPWPLPNVWLGVSVEDQRRADERIPWLLETPAAVRFISVEPLLGPVEVDPWLKIHKHWKTADSTKEAPWHPPYPRYWYEPQALVMANWRCPLHWIIAGCESGPGARPMDEDWVRSLRDQCVAAGVPFFLKQAMRDGKLVKLPFLDGRQHVEWPK